MGSNRHYFKRGVSFLKRNGIKATMAKVHERLARDAEEKYYVPEPVSDEELAYQRSREFATPYKFSILVPVYETDPELFRNMLDSVGEQTYGNWELILADASADDSRRGIVRAFLEEYNLMCRDIYGTIFDKVKYVRLGANEGISGNTNRALAHATGDYVALLDHDDILANTALFDIMTAMEEAQEKERESESISKIMAVYTDEDKVSFDGTQYYDPNIKPDFDPVLLCTNNYICHFFLADTNLAKGVGGFRSDYDGAQDHDFILRCTEGIRRDRILHVKKVLYHWRSSPGSTSDNPDAKLYAYEAGKRAVTDHLRRSGVDTDVSDTVHLGFFSLSYAPFYTSVLTIPPRELEGMRDFADLSFKDEFVMVLGTDIVPADDEFIDEMLPCMNLPNVGAVTGRIIGRDGKIESAGFEIGADGTLQPMYAGQNRKFSGYMHRTVLDRLVDGFAQDCVLLRRDAVKEWFPKVTLKERFDIYYTPKVVFKRRGR